VRHALAKLFVYDVADTPVRVSVSSVVVAPVSTLMRRFWPVLLTTRKRSTTGLKSTPKSVPSSAVNGFVVSVESAASSDFCVAAPLVVLIV
jgi:hypothetical protein